MDVDDVAPTGSGMFPISSLYEPNYLHSRISFFFAGQPLGIDPALLLTADSGSTYGKSTPMIHEASLFF